MFDLERGDKLLKKFKIYCQSFRILVFIKLAELNDSFIEDCHCDFLSNWFVKWEIHDEIMNFRLKSAVAFFCFPNEFIHDVKVKKSFDENVNALLFDFSLLEEMTKKSDWAHRYLYHFICQCNIYSYQTCSNNVWWVFFILFESLFKIFHDVLQSLVFVSPL